jgi:asparagine synthase (glutamine-hydrolysing)
MCGIAGIIGNNKLEILNSMLLATKHRGPDNSGTYADDLCSIGMNRLSILDLSNAGHQPMYSDDKRYVIVYNGEVYNFKSIRVDLIKFGFTFHSNSDTEVVLKGYIAYGKDILNKIRGMFAFVVWDTHTQTAFGARDHMGIKPLYYHQANGEFTFCSEIKGMLQQPSIKKQVSKDGLRLFLSYGYVGAPFTILDNVFALKPGECFNLTKKNLKIETYWDIPQHKPTELSYSEAKEKLKKLVIEKVSEELVSDVPLGLFLSGGLDSTVVLAAMRLNGKEQIETFSLGFEGFEASEEKEAEIAAKHFNTKHNTHIISGKTVAQEFDGFIDAMDQPCIDGLNVYLVSKYTRQNVTVALSGLGPDELFLGYKWQRSAAAPALINPLLYKTIEPLLKKLTPKRYKGILDYIKNSQDPITFYSTINKIISDDELKYLDISIDAKEKNVAWVKSFDNMNESDIFSRVSRLDMKLFMGARVLPISDATSMYHSLEVRFPLIDRELVEFSRTLPASYKMDLDKAKHIRPWSKYEGIESYEGSGVKKILYEAFKSELPQGFGSRAKKGFKFPYQQWMNKELKEFYTTHEDLAKIPEGWHKLILINWLKKHNISLLD